MPGEESNDCNVVLKLAGVEHKGNNPLTTPRGSGWGFERKSSPWKRGHSRTNKGESPLVDILGGGTPRTLGGFKSDGHEIS